MNQARAHMLGSLRGADLAPPPAGWGPAAAAAGSPGPGVRGPSARPPSGIGSLPPVGSPVNTRHGIEPPLCELAVRYVADSNICVHAIRG